MLITNRVILGDNGTLSDLSVNLNSYAQGEETTALVSAEDYIYIGSELPFNHRWFELGTTANANAATISVDLWDGDSWEAAVDIIDDTGSVPFSANGMLQWTQNPEKNWSARDTEDMTSSGLETLKIFGLYWLRLSVSADLTVGTALSFVGHRFSSDSDLGVVYPELNTSNMRNMFNNGTAKADWNEQHFEAAKAIIRFLKRDGHLVSGNQLLDPSVLTEASVHWVAQIAFAAFGSDYQDNFQRARLRFTEALELVEYRVDKDGDTRLDSADEFISDFKVVRR